MKRNHQIAAAADSAAECFGNGFHCAEAVAWAVLEALKENPAQAAAHATAFGGGFGRSFEEACGALSGGLIAIGHLHGRSAPEGEWDVPAKFGAELRKRFVKDFGTTHCATLRERFGQERQMGECRKLVHGVVVRLLELLEENPDKFDALSCDRPVNS
ncbi:MAG: C-GCAxxG-C-C family protein [Desulfobacteraceae bacterium]|jgi:C_GCAxxG_C_C family probable redox protein